LTNTTAKVFVAGNLNTNLEKQEEFEDTKDRQHNGQKKQGHKENQKSTKHYTEIVCSSLFYGF
jgi:hypothetical protein